MSFLLETDILYEVEDVAKKRNDLLELQKQ